MRSINPTNTALFVIDMQGGFLDDGAPIHVPGGATLIPGICNAVEKARSMGMTIVWTRVSIEHTARSVYRELWPHHFLPDGRNVLSRGSSNYEIVAPLRDMVSAGDIVIDKDRYSAFYQTNLDLLLKDRGIINTLFSGVVTNICVESTLRDAYHRNYYSILLSDCTKTFSPALQKLSEEIVSLAFGQVATWSEVESTIMRS